jgi:hypothetical protein
VDWKVRIRAGYRGFGRGAIEGIDRKIVSRDSLRREFTAKAKPTVPLMKLIHFSMIFMKARISAFSEIAPKSLRNRSEITPKSGFSTDGRRVAAYPLYNFTAF